MVIVGFGTALIGTAAAWLVVMTEFPGRRLLEWALLAPLAMPAYIGAYALVDLLEYAGPVQTSLRALFGWQDARDYWFPEIRSIWSAGMVLTLALYPYVYLLARAAFREQSVCALEVGRALGCGPLGAFFGASACRWRVRRWWAGSAIAMMETLNDFGAVDYFNVPTLTRGIFAIWLDTYNAGGAAQIALVMLGFVLLLLAMERISRRGKRFHHTSRRYRPIRRTRPKPPASPDCDCRLRRAGAGRVCVSGAGGGLACLSACGAMGRFQLLGCGGQYRRPGLTGGAGILCSRGLHGLWRTSLAPQRGGGWLAQATALGYAAPGAVLAVGVLIPLAALDHRIADLAEAVFDIDPGLILTGSAAAVVFAYVVRFSAIAHGAIDGGLRACDPIDGAGRPNAGRNPQGRR